MAKYRPEVVEILWTELPKSPQELAFERVSEIFALTPDRIDDMAHDERTHWAGFVEAVAACYTRDERRRIGILGNAAILDLYDVGNSGVNFTEFALFTRAKRYAEEITSYKPQPDICPELVYAEALWHFRSS